MSPTVSGVEGDPGRRIVWCFRCRPPGERVWVSSPMTAVYLQASVTKKAPTPYLLINDMTSVC